MFTLNSQRIIRPAGPHPRPAHWEKLRQSVFRRQGGRCACCPEDAVDLHHRHYDTWGRERIQDVTGLCRQCHDAITSRLRTAQNSQRVDRWAAPVRRVDNCSTPPTRPEAAVSLNQWRYHR